METQDILELLPSSGAAFNSDFHCGLDLSSKYETVTIRENSQGGFVVSGHTGTAPVRLDIIPTKEVFLGLLAGHCVVEYISESEIPSRAKLLWALAELTNGIKQNDLSDQFGLTESACEEIFNLGAYAQHEVVGQ